MSVTFTPWDPNLDQYLAVGDMVGFRESRSKNMTDVSCNFHNQGAMDILEMLGLQSDFCGRIPSVDLPAIRRSIIKVKNLPGRRAPFVTSGGTEGRIHWGGQPDSLILSRLDDFDAVLKYCIENGWDLQWS